MASNAINPTEVPLSTEPPTSKDDLPSVRQSIQNEKDIPSGAPSSLVPDTKPEPEPVEWKPSKRLYVAFLTLAVITLMVALDGTSLSVALPVRLSVDD
jgi:hypothetical protein